MILRNKAGSMRRRRSLLAIFMMLSGLPASTRAEDLDAKLERMGTLRATTHYRIFGTISPKRAEEYARRVELIYREFDRQYSSFLGVFPPSKNEYLWSKST